MEARATKSRARHTAGEGRLATFFLLGVAALAVLVLTFVPRIPQDPAYHRFADQRTIGGIPHFWNVASNLPFLLVGLFGCRAALRRDLRGGLRQLRAAYLVFFAGVTLVALGSGYYHWSPSNSTLVWDRLPMTLGFMGFFAALVGENVSMRAAGRLLWPLVGAGALSVVYWHFTEVSGAGDLRPYALVQFLPILLTPVILLLFRSPWRSNAWVWGMLGAYLLSKGAEVADFQLYRLLGGISGHSIKHLLAAGGALLLALALRYRARSVG